MDLSPQQRVRPVAEASCSVVGHTVTLKPNEATIYYTLEKPFGSPFHKLRDEINELTVTYFIPKEFGQRHNIWHGSVTSKPFPVSNKQVQLPTKEK